jgi:hypothetical protein
MFLYLLVLFGGLECDGRPLLCLGRPFCILERCLQDANLEAAVACMDALPTYV